MIKKERYKNIALIAFDADDTLWENEPKYKHAERIFADILSKYVPEDIIVDELLKTEIQNLKICGYGSKSFCMSMIETAIRITNYKITAEELYKIYDMGKSLLQHPIILYDKVSESLDLLREKYPLALITKGDTLEQERKLFSSGLMDKFNFIEIVHEKNEETYLKLIKKYEITPEQFMMVGNSPKSDILPVLNIGGFAIYIPSPQTWHYEIVDEAIYKSFNTFTQLENISDVINLINK